MPDFDVRSKFPTAEYLEVLKNRANKYDLASSMIEKGLSGFKQGLEISDTVRKMMERRERMQKIKEFSQKFEEPQQQELNEEVNVEEQVNVVVPRKRKRGRPKKNKDVAGEENDVPVAKKTKVGTRSSARVEGILFFLLIF